MLGKTNAVAGSGGGSTGDLITAVNRTGNLIQQGEKVWINKDGLVAGSQFYFGSGGIGLPLVSSDGQFASANGEVYNISSGSGIHAYSSRSPSWAKYSPGGQLIAGTYPYSMSFDSGKQWDNGNLDEYICNSPGYFAHGGASNNQFKLVDMGTGQVIKSITVSSTAEDLGKRGIYAYGYCYYVGRMNSKYSRYQVTDIETASPQLVESSYNSSLGSDYYPFGITSDSKYVLATQSQAHLSSSKKKLCMLEFSDNGNTLRELSNSEMPSELQPFAAETYNLYMFNPSCGVLTVGGYNQYSPLLAMQYKDGSWLRLSLPENVESRFGLSVDNLLSVCCGRDDTAAGATPCVTKLSTSLGYQLTAYSTSSYDKNTLTGKALQDIPNLESGEVSTVLAGEKIS